MAEASGVRNRSRSRSSERNSSKIDTPIESERTLTPEVRFALNRLIKYIVLIGSHGSSFPSNQTEVINSNVSVIQTARMCESSFQSMFNPIPGNNADQAAQEYTQKYDSAMGQIRADECVNFDDLSPTIELTNTKNILEKIKYSGQYNLRGVFEQLKECISNPGVDDPSEKFKVLGQNTKLVLRTCNPRVSKFYMEEQVVFRPGCHAIDHGIWVLDVETGEIIDGATMFGLTKMEVNMVDANEASKCAPPQGKRPVTESSFRQYELSKGVVNQVASKCETNKKYKENCCSNVEIVRNMFAKYNDYDEATKVLSSKLIPHLYGRRNNNSTYRIVTRAGADGSIIESRDVLLVKDLMNHPSITDIPTLFIVKACKGPNVGIVMDYAKKKGITYEESRQTISRIRSIPPERSGAILLTYEKGGVDKIMVGGGGNYHTRRKTKKNKHRNRNIHRGKPRNRITKKNKLKKKNKNKNKNMKKRK
jgi:hypothetical protein